MPVGTTHLELKEFFKEYEILDEENVYVEKQNPNKNFSRGIVIFNNAENLQKSKQNLHKTRFGKKKVHLYFMKKELKNEENENLKENDVGFYYF